MIFWVILLGGMLIAALLGVFYLVTRFHKFLHIQKLAENHKATAWLISALPVVACFLFGLINMYAAVIVLLHMVLFWALCDLAARIIKRRKNAESKHYYAGAAALLISAVYLGAGWFFAHHVFETRYELTTDKSLPDGHVRAAMFADSHLGITLDGEKFAREMQRIAKAEPDVVFLVGDFVDDDSSRDDMITACKALGELDSQVQNGVIYVDGNHDKGYGNYRDFTIDELYTELENNGVTILRDEIFSVGGIDVVGRKDKSDDERLEIAELMADEDGSPYTVILDHQPSDYDNEAATCADLVLSGHTHGGHIFPAGYVGLWSGINDRIYGSEVRNDTTFIVTSGISGWAIPFKTGCISEYVIIDIGEV